MTKKDYIKIARVLKENKNIFIYDVVCWKMADMLFEDNPNFRYRTFYEACEAEGMLH